MKKAKFVLCAIALVMMLVLIGCPQGKAEEGPEPVMEEELAGTWVNDNTSDISFVLNLYDLNGKVCCGAREFPTRFGSRNAKNRESHLSLKDLTSDTTFFDWYMKKISDSGNTAIINLYAKYENGKIEIFPSENGGFGVMLGPNGSTMISQKKENASDEYHRLFTYGEVVGTYSKKK